MPDPHRFATAAPRTSELAGLIGLFVLGVCWLIPNKAAPWTSMWNESAAALGLALLALVPLGARPGAAPRPALAWPLATLAGAAIALAWAQWGLGLLHYAGDAWLVTLYLGWFALAAATGHSLAARARTEGWLTGLLLAVLAAGLVSAGLVLMQWLWAYPLTVLAVEMAPTSRPFANLGQPNQASTLLFLALCCALQLRRERHMGVGAAGLTVVVLSLAMAVTQSRTGVLQLLVLAVWSAWMGRGQRKPGEARWGLLVLALGAAWWLLMPWIDDVLMLSKAAREIGLDQARGDLRPAVWRAYAQAAWLHPWAGWGWLQSGWAQESVAACRPGLRYYFNYAHLLPLDLVVWLGIPCGLAVFGLLGWWLWRHLPARHAAASGYWLAAVLGLLLHAMLEYPLAYLYFLLPLGLMMGVVDALDPRHRALRFARPTWLVAWLLLVALAALTLRDAGRAASIHTDIQFENARIGAQRRVVEVPPMMLDHLQAHLRLNAADLAQPASADALAAYGAAARRFPVQLSILRYAMALQVSGQPDAARQQQQLFCDIYGARHCAKAADKWREWQREHPALPLGDFKGQVLPPRCPPRPAGSG